MDTQVIVGQSNVNDRCRTCMLRVGNSTHNIFERNIQNISIAEILHSFTALTFDDNDILPKVICQRCHEKLENFYKFIVHIEYVDTKLKEMCKEKACLSFEQDLKKNFHSDEEQNDALLSENNCSFVKEEYSDEENYISEDNIFVSSGDNTELIEPCSLKCETEQEYLCRICNKCFTNERNYLRHNKKHLNLTKRVCGINNSKDLLSQHVETGILNEPNCASTTTSQENCCYPDNLCDYKTDTIEIEDNTIKRNINYEDKSDLNSDKPIDEDIKCNIQKSLTTHIKKHYNFKDCQNSQDTENLLEITVKDSVACEVCKRRFRNKYSMSAHMRKHVVKGRILSCSTCNKVFSKLNHLKRHRFLLHNDNSELSTNFHNNNAKDILTDIEKSEFICEICQRIFKKKDSMLAHMRKHVESGRALSCSICSKVFSKISNLKRHQVLYHADDNEMSTNCQIKDATPISADTDEGEFICEICQRRFKKKHSMSAHMRKHVEKGRVLSCSKCGKVFSKVSHVKRHEMTHEDKLRFKCGICNKSYFSKDLLEQHLKQHKDAKTCPVCQKSFTNMPALNTHIKIHTRSKLYLCSYCGKRFDSSTNLNQHHKRHIGIKTFACSLCPRKFVTKGELTSHTGTHTGERPHKCKQCNAVFTKNSSLVKHTYRHLGIKPYHCDTCFKKFTTKGSLKLHYRIHTGEKPYSCDICSRAFTQSNDLDKHRRRHLGDKLFKCNQCAESFRLKTELKHHIAQHYVAQLQETNNQHKNINTVNEKSEE